MLKSPNVNPESLLMNVVYICNRDISERYIAVKLFHSILQIMRNSPDQNKVWSFKLHCSGTIEYVRSSADHNKV